MISDYLLAAGSAWAIAQLIKYCLAAAKSGQWFNTSSVLHSGNMPSVHTATTVSLAMIVGLKDGVDSGLFALSLLLMAIVAYDAMGVRRATGEQGMALRKLLKPQDKKPYISLGHQPLEVFVGALIGLAVGAIVAFFTATS